MILKIIYIYLAVGFILNFSFIVWDKARKPEQRPETYLEVLVMVVMFILGIPLWPFAWRSRIADCWRKPGE